MCKIEIGNFIAEQQQDGTFLYKSKEVVVPTLNKVEKRDKVMFQVQIPLEGKLKSRGEKMIKNIVSQTIKKLNNAIQ